MISVNVISEEKAWLKKIKKKNFFFKRLGKFFPEKYKFLNKKIFLFNRWPIKILKS